MTLSELDVLVRVAGATLLLWALATRAGAARRRRWFAPLAVCLCGFLAGNTPEPELRLSDPLGALGDLLSGWAAVFLWWFCLSVFDRRFRPHGLVLGVGVAWLLIAAVDRGLLGPALADIGLSRVLVVIGFGMVAHLAWRLIRDRGGDLIERRREARVLVVLALAGQLFADLAVDVLLGFSWRPQLFAVVQNGAFLVFTGWLLALDLPDDEPRTAVQAPPPAPVEKVDPAVAGRVRRLVEVEKAHLDPELRFEDFVRRAGGSERAVRRAILHDYGHDHFRAFLNALRVEEARRLLADPARSGDKLVGVAFDSGFGALASFNRAFRDLEGCAPSVYRDRLRAAAPATHEAGF